MCDLIEQGLERKLTLISAPAGYGKTSALVDFAQHTSVPVCWYTVDERDRDVDLFIRYIIGAIQEQFPDSGERAREAVVSRGSKLFREPTAVIADLVNEMLDLGTDFALVIDNFEPVEGALGIREFIHRLIEVLPSNCHLMMGSRVLPNVPVTQLVAKRQLVGLTEQHLRFGPDEIRKLLHRSGIDVSETKAKAIATGAEGWITGVLLVLDLLREDAEPALLDAQKATSQTYEYLALEVLERQPRDLRRFLRKSSVLREMSARLCRDVLGIAGARFLFPEVERRNLFLTRFGDESGATYRYHHLFRNFLQRRLCQRDEALYVDLHRRAGLWFEREYHVEEAVYHYLAAEAYPEATELMERVAMEWFTRGRVETLIGWAEALPDEVRSRAPRLFLYQSRVLTDRYDYEGAREALDLAETGFRSQGDALVLAKVHIQRATLALFESRFRDAVAEAQLALGMLPPTATAERADAKRHIGKAYVRLGRVDEGVAELKEALGLFRQTEGPYDVLNLLQDLTHAYASHGHLDEAAACLGEALPLARQLGSASQLASVLNNLGWIREVRGDYRESLKLYEEGVAAAQRGRDPRSQANIAEGLATLYRNIGDYRQAELLYDVAWRIARESRPALAILIVTARADMYRWQGDHARALALLEQAHELAEDHALHVERQGGVRLTKGIALAESGDLAEGIQLLSRSLSFFEEQGAQRDLARGFFLRAKAYLLGGQEGQAVEDLGRAMELAQAMDTDQFAVVEGQHVVELLQLGVAEGISLCRGTLERVKELSELRQELVRGGGERGEATEVHLEIYALGEGRVERDGRPVSSSEWRAAMARELFFYILLNGPVERDVVGAVFWPDLPTDRMTSNFHSTLYRVRQAVGSDAVVVKGGKYTLGVDYWFDVEAFEALVQRARLLPPRDWQARELWKRAVELYHGSFLPEVDRAWCVAKREELCQTYVEALIELARCCEVRGAFEEAISWYRQALDRDELREDIHRSIMRAYAEVGRRSDALAQYDLCRKILRQELGVEPSRKTQRLCEEVASGMAD